MNTLSRREQRSFISLKASLKDVFSYISSVNYHGCLTLMTMENTPARLCFSDSKLIFVKYQDATNQDALELMAKESAWKFKFDREASAESSDIAIDFTRFCQIVEQAGSQVKSETTSLQAVPETPEPPVSEDAIEKGALTSNVDETQPAVQEIEEPVEIVESPVADVGVDSGVASLRTETETESVLDTEQDTDLPPVPDAQTNNNDLSSEQAAEPVITEGVGTEVPDGDVAITTDEEKADVIQDTAARLKMMLEKADSAVDRRIIEKGATSDQKASPMLNLSGDASPVEAETVSAGSQDNLDTREIPPVEPVNDTPPSDAVQQNDDGAPSMTEVEELSSTVEPVLNNNDNIELDSVKQEGAIQDSTNEISSDNQSSSEEPQPASGAESVPIIEKAQTSAAAAREPLTDQKLAEDKKQALQSLLKRKFGADHDVACASFVCRDDNIFIQGPAYRSADNSGLTQAIHEMLAEECRSISLFEQQAFDSNNTGKFKQIIMSTELGKVLLFSTQDKGFGLAILLAPEINPAFILVGMAAFLDEITQTLQ